MALHCDESKWYSFPKKLDQNFLLEKKATCCWQRVFLIFSVKGRKTTPEPVAQQLRDVSMMKSRGGFLGAEHSEC